MTSWTRVGVARFELAPADPADLTVGLVGAEQPIRVVHNVKGRLDAMGDGRRVDIPSPNVDADGIPMICLPMHAGSQVGPVDRRLQRLQIAVAGYRGAGDGVDRGRLPLHDLLIQDGQCVTVDLRVATVVLRVLNRL